MGWILIAGVILGIAVGSMTGSTQLGWIIIGLACLLVGLLEAKRQLK